MTLALSQAPLNRQLRAATHEAHVRLNRHPLLNLITRPSLDIPTYTMILQLYCQFYQAAEALIRDALANGLADFDYSHRYKATWLAQDLEYFERSSGLNGNQPDPVELVAPRNQAELVGIMYPLEGSTLGGQVISKHLLRNLGITRNTGGRFFNGYGKETPQFWEEFQRFACHAVSCPDEQDRACDYARYLFEQLEAYLDAHVS
ncbi:MAG: heme oxygenase-like protein [Marinobacter sp. T13-3]|jgi:heme oxygenase|nr:MAG: heme oxygenase-like protein [Marinobacter sp. T13-3]